jgi:alpha-galactosidase
MTLTSRSLTACLALAWCAGTLAAAAPGAAAEAKGPVKVFILAGQSNMEGKATAHTLDAVIDDPKTHDQFKHLKTGGRWTVREDVWVTFLDREGESDFPPYGPLTVGFGSPRLDRDENNKRVPVLTIGPELGIGYVLGDHFDEQVLLIKAAWGGRAVRYSFRPPSAMPTDEQIRQEVAAIKAKKPDADVTFESHKAGYGSDYRKILSETRKVLGDVKHYFPTYDPAHGYEIAGFIWFQGWNDGVGGGNPDYVEQMAHFIRDIRKDLGTPNLPFVIGELGTDGPEAGGWIATFREQQAAIAAMPEFADNVRLARTAPFWPTYPNLDDKWQAFRAAAKANQEKAETDPTRVDPGQYYRENWVQRYKKELSYTSDKRYHYKGSGACYYQMGEAMGRAMLEMIRRQPRRLASPGHAGRGTTLAHGCAGPARMVPHAVG